MTASRSRARRHDAARPPCSAEPERWFDRADRTHALAACLQCPARRWCAREALLSRSVLGHVGRNLDRRQAVRGRALPRRHRYRYPGDSNGSCDHPGGVPYRLDRAHTGRHSAPGRCVQDDASRCARQCWRDHRDSARSWPPQCRLAADTQASRIPGAVASDATSAATVYATCTRCADAVHATIDPTSARRFGYRVDSPAHAPNVPFYWRQCRWVLLGRAGELLDATTVADIACAS